ncbi:hypothetical protein AVEN_197642-1 [Araneus ventricosus]|uniref:Uncharacterized protein n=1 Tax=Araneus ventricosus TaxID=182803 RepID=A0A4Y2JEY4_ARAVE|nr:hypothetical protein AVEN_197642-1 [Araneus ventricosus]
MAKIWSRVWRQIPLALPWIDVAACQKNMKIIFENTVLLSRLHHSSVSCLNPGIVGEGSASMLTDWHPSFNINQAAAMAFCRNRSNWRRLPVGRNFSLQEPPKKCPDLNYNIFPWSTRPCRGLPPFLMR